MLVAIVSSFSHFHFLARHSRSLSTFCSSFTYTLILPNRATWFGLTDCSHWCLLFSNALCPSSVFILLMNEEVNVFYQQLNLSHHIFTLQLLLSLFSTHGCASSLRTFPSACRIFLFSHLCGISTHKPYLFAAFSLLLPSVHCTNSLLHLT